MFPSIALNLNVPAMMCFLTGEKVWHFICSKLSERKVRISTKTFLMSSLCIMKNNDLSSLATLLIVWGQRRVDSKILLERKVAPLTISSKICTYVSPGHISFCELGNGF